MKTLQYVVSVASIRRLSSAVKEFVLVPSNHPLPAYSPGSHIVINIAGEKPIANAYSLITDPKRPGTYIIAVRKQDDSKGGSAYLHDLVAEGDELLIDAPANFFPPVWSARKHVLIAGGIGVTPFLSYIPEFISRDIQFELHYSYRDRSGVYIDELRECVGNKFFAYLSESGHRCDIRGLLEKQSLGSHFYVCGPESLIRSVQQIALDLEIPDGYIHCEAFSTDASGKPFEIELASTGKRLSVGAEESVLDVLERAGVTIDNGCRAGVCGRCECGVIEGIIEHRDQCLSDSVKSKHDRMLVCVSRARSGVLMLDL
ncbi:PDR/VanB family oxidoreductase [Sessilibacter corallicola]|uniref:PDR/VanB family oxidoreductase n=1 Tax=Sessilibacter corallicola TaxID=2904075 RepID=UPI001E3B6D4D|nr:PDR/VanB family oxidoreductase [Sessilibacter corallicola]MCE2029850.1 PDR/VanB family oxidoreductase [Sessilibacter corallicola]